MSGETTAIPKASMHLKIACVVGGEWGALSSLEESLEELPSLLEEILSEEPSSDEESLSDENGLAGGDLTLTVSRKYNRKRYVDLVR